jgi:hypothetical protein
MAAPHVSFSDGSGGVKFPQVPKPGPNARGGVIKHSSSFAIPMSDNDEPVSAHDRADGDFTGPVSVPPPKAAPDDGGLPKEWLPAPSKTVSHD